MPNNDQVCNPWLILISPWHILLSACFIPDNPPPQLISLYKVSASSACVCVFFGTWNGISLLQHFDALGLQSHFIRLIHACISTPTFSILVNGEPTADFLSQRGIRQGCPLSLTSSWLPSMSSPSPYNMNCRVLT